MYGGKSDDPIPVRHLWQDGSEVCDVSGDDPTALHVSNCAHGQPYCLREESRDVFLAEVFSVQPASEFIGSCEKCTMECQY